MYYDLFLWELCERQAAFFEPHQAVDGFLNPLRVSVPFTIGFNKMPFNKECKNKEKKKADI